MTEQKYFLSYSWANPRGMSSGFGCMVHTFPKKMTANELIVEVQKFAKEYDKNWTGVLLYFKELKPEE